MDIWIDLGKYIGSWYLKSEFLDGIINNIKKEIEKSNEIEKTKFADLIISEVEKITEKFLGTEIEQNYVVKFFRFLNRLFELEINLNYDSLMILLNRRFSDVHLTFRRYLLNLYKAGNQKYSNLLVNDSLTFATNSIFLKNCLIGMEKCSQIEKIIQNMDSKNVFIDMLCIEEEKLEKIRELLIFFELTPLFAEELPESKEMMCKICYLIQTSKYAIVEKNSPSNSVIFEYGLLKGLGIKCLSIFDGRKKYYISDETLKDEDGKIELSKLRPLKFTDLLGIEHQTYNSDIELFKMLGKLNISEIPERNKEKDEELEAFIKQKEKNMKPL
ncbi:MAG: hypothetical protein HWN67_03670 [Candidatus Helarchaeota archaeon]|nr:hypothetical protein [Candidatus Helarchaeota archaeon]